MQGNVIIAIFIAILLSIVALGWAIYCWCHRHVKIGVMISQAHARVARDRAEWDPERGQYIHNSYIPRYTWQGWVRAKRPKREQMPREPDYVILRTVRSGNNWTEQRANNRALQPNTRPNPRGQRQKAKPKTLQQTAAQNPQKGQQQKQQKGRKQPQPKDTPNPSSWEKRAENNTPGGWLEDAQPSPAPAGSVAENPWNQNQNAAASAWDQEARTQDTPMGWRDVQQGTSDGGWTKEKNKKGKQWFKQPKAGSDNQAW